MQNNTITEESLIKRVKQQNIILDKQRIEKLKLIEKNYNYESSPEVTNANDRFRSLKASQNNIHT